MIRRGALGAIAVAALLAATGALGAAGSAGKILFVRYDPSAGLYGLYSVRPDGTALHRIARGFRDQGMPTKVQSARWSPDGKRVAYVYTDRGLMIANADGTALRRVASGDVRDIAWSPDGRRIAFAVVRNPDALYVATLGRRPHRLVVAPAAGWVADPAWSPDGRTIAYSFGGVDPRFDQIRVVRPDGTGKRKLATAVDNLSLDWSADSRSIAYARGAGVGYDVFLLRRDGAGPRRLTYTNDVWTGPRWAPTGAAIAYGVVVGKNESQLVVQPTPGAPAQRIDDDDHADHLGAVRGAFAWSPDATRIAFYRETPTAIGGLERGLYVAAVGAPGVTKVVDGEVGVMDWR